MSDFRCHADSDVFIKLEEALPLEVQRLIPRRGLPCSGSGLTGLWCSRCPFGEEKYTPEWFDQAYEDENKFDFGRDEYFHNSLERL